MDRDIVALVDVGDLAGAAQLAAARRALLARAEPAAPIVSLAAERARRGR